MLLGNSLFVFIILRFRSFLIYSLFVFGIFLFYNVITNGLLSVFFYKYYNKWFVECILFKCYNKWFVEYVLFINVITNGLLRGGNGNFAERIIWGDLRVCSTNVKFSA